MTTAALQADSRIISMRVNRTVLHHPVVFTPNVESVEIDNGRQRSSQTGEKVCGTRRQSRISNFNEALNEVRSLLQRDDESRSQGEDGQEARPAQCLQSQLGEG